MRGYPFNIFDSKEGVEIPETMRLRELRPGFGKRI